jgi:hypothetical protein
MANRRQLNDDDLTVIEESLGSQINEGVLRAQNDSNERADIMSTLGPLFRVREKILTMKGKDAAKPAARARTTRTKTAASTPAAD